MGPVHTEGVGSVGEVWEVLGRRDGDRRQRWGRGQSRQHPFRIGCSRSTDRIDTINIPRLYTLTLTCAMPRALTRGVLHTLESPHSLTQHDALHHPPLSQPREAAQRPSILHTSHTHPIELFCQEELSVVCLKMATPEHIVLELLYGLCNPHHLQELLGSCVGGKGGSGCG